MWDCVSGCAFAAELEAQRCGFPPPPLFLFNVPARRKQRAAPARGYDRRDEVLADVMLLCPVASTPTSSPSPRSRTTARLEPCRLLDVLAMTVIDEGVAFPLPETTATTFSVSARSSRSGKVGLAICQPSGSCLPDALAARSISASSSRQGVESGGNVSSSRTSAGLHARRGRRARRRAAPRVCRRRCD